MASFISGVAFHFFFHGKRDSLLAGAAYLNLQVAEAFLLQTVVSGVAWQFAFEGAKLERFILVNFVAALFAALPIIAFWWLHCQAANPKHCIFLAIAFLLNYFCVAVIAL